MWVIVAALFVFMKFVVLAAAGAGLSLPRAIAFFFWPGMRPAPFAVPRRKVGGVRERLFRGTRNVACGVVLFSSPGAFRSCRRSSSCSPPSA
jgi:hypothetical protein